MKAWELLSKPGAWTQGAFARGKNGIKTTACSKKALCWCASGAIEKIYGVRRSVFIEGRLTEALSVESVFPWNDAPERTQEEVVAKLKELDL